MAQILQLNQRCSHAWQPTRAFTCQRPPRPRHQASICRAVPSTQLISPGAAPGLRPEPWTNSPQQQQALQTLRQRMEASPWDCPDEATLQWYLRDRYFDVNEAEQKLRAMLRWRSQFRPADLTAASVAAELATGKAYVHTHPDKFGRPAIVIRACRHITGEFPIADSKRFCTYLLDEAIASLPPGQEQIIGVFDLRGFDLRNADFGFAEFMIEAFFKYYPRRVSQVLMVDAPWVFKGPWTVIRPLMRKYAALVEFVSREQLLQETFTPKTVPDDFKR